MWSEVNFGKWRGKGKTLPQIMVSDPDWFFWALEEGAFKGMLKSEADKLARRARAIKLPMSLAGTHCIQYMFTSEGKFAGFNVIPSNRPAHVGSSSESRSPTLDLAAPRCVRSYDKLGAKLLLASFKSRWLADKTFTKARVEAFFDNPGNFVSP